MPKRSSIKPDSKQQRAGEAERNAAPAILFDLDGTLVDSVYEHVFAWREALAEEGVRIPNARIHRGIGMSGKLLLCALFKEIGHKRSPEKIERLERLHNKNLAKGCPVSECCRGPGNCSNI
jgi:beta-phosphoglucomutase-like phosphatase (HAD superfamily)